MKLQDLSLHIWIRGRWIFQLNIPHCSLTVNKWPWWWVYASGDDEAMATFPVLACTHINTSWMCSLQVFSKRTAILDDKRSINRKISSRWKPWFVNPVGCPGLVLAWSCTLGSLIVLQLLFVMTITSVSNNFQFGRRIFSNILKNNDPSKMNFHSIKNWNRTETS